MSIKIAYILSHPIQYFSPFFRRLANTPGIELTVYYGKNTETEKTLDRGFGKVIAWDTPLLDGYKYEFLKNFSSSVSLDNRFFSLVNPGVIDALCSDKSEIVIVHGWSYFTNVISILAGWWLRKKVWLRGENPYSQELSKPAWIRLIKRMVLQFGLFKLIDSFLYIGSENKKFYLYYGVSSDKLVYCPYAVDNLFFQDKASLLSGMKIPLKKKYGIPEESVVILFSGKYIAKKRPMDLLHAFTKLSHPSVALVMVGEGELRSQMEDFIYKCDIKNVFLKGFINQDEISNFYALADVFVLPSGKGETWGLVINEAMNFHLPIVCSTTVGSSTDLVVCGENGFVYEEGDIGSLTRNLQILLEDPNLRKNCGRRSFEIIKNFNYDVMIQNLVVKINTMKRNKQ